MSDHHCTNTPEIKPCPICHELRIMPPEDEMLKPKHTWRRRYCACGLFLCQDEVEDIINASPLTEALIAETPRLLPCPFCGESKDIGARTHIDYDDLWFVVCAPCGAESGRALQEKHAINLWNTRKNSEAK